MNRYERAETEVRDLFLRWHLSSHPAQNGRYFFDWLQRCRDLGLPTEPRLSDADTLHIDKWAFYGQVFAYMDRRQITLRRIVQIGEEFGHKGGVLEMRRRDILQHKAIDLEMERRQAARKVYDFWTGEPVQGPPDFWEKVSLVGTPRG